MNFQKKIAVGIVDIAVLVELCISMYVSNHDPENFTSVFCTYFFSMLIPTLIAAWLVISRLGKGSAIMQSAAGQE